MEPFASSFSYGERVVFPVERVASRARLHLEDVYALARHNTGDLWALQRQVFEARIAALKVMIQDGYQPVSEPNINIIIEVEQRAVSDDAGDVGLIPESMHHWMTYRYEGLNGGG